MRLVTFKMETTWNCLSMYVIVSLVLKWTLMTCSAQEDKYMCAPEWIGLGNRCFIAGSTTLTFDEAVKYCQNLYRFATLASIHSHSEEQLARDLQIKERDHLWLGWKSPSHYRNPEWVDGTPLDYTKWKYQRKATEFLDFVCAEFTQTAQWRKVECYNKRRPLCASPLHSKEDLLGECSEPYQDFLQYKNTCYAVFENDTKSWKEAEDHCQSLNSHLMSIPTKEDRFVYSLLTRQDEPRSFWMGIRSNMNKMFITWTDHNLVTYTNWGQREPHNTANQSCGAFHSKEGKWFTDNCAVNRSFICKHNLVQSLTPAPSIEGACPSADWSDFGGFHCYKIEAEDSWELANKRCRQIGAELASIHNEAENRWITMHLEKMRSIRAWIGLYKPFHDNAFRWSDGSDQDFSNWKNQEPGNKDPNCAKIIGNGLWQAAKCYENNAYVCKYKKVPEQKIIGNLTHQYQKTSTNLLENLLRLSQNQSDLLARQKYQMSSDHLEERTLGNITYLLEKLLISHQNQSAFLTRKNYSTSSISSVSEEKILRNMSHLLEKLLRSNQNQSTLLADQRYLVPEEEMLGNITHLLDRLLTSHQNQSTLLAIERYLLQRNFSEQSSVAYRDSTSWSQSGPLWFLVFLVLIGLLLHVYYLLVKRKIFTKQATRKEPNGTSLGLITGSTIYEKSEDHSL